MRLAIGNVATAGVLTVTHSTTPSTSPPPRPPVVRRPCFRCYMWSAGPLGPNCKQGDPAQAGGCLLRSHRSCHLPPNQTALRAHMSLSPRVTRASAATPPLANLPGCRVLADDLWVYNLFITQAVAEIRAPGPWLCCRRSESVSRINAQGRKKGLEFRQGSFGRLESKHSHHS